jgi:tight adherence protein B
MNSEVLNNMRQLLASIKSKIQQGQYFFSSGETGEFSPIVQYCETTGARLLIVVRELERIINLLTELDNLRTKALVMPKATIKILRFLPLVSLGLAVVFGADVVLMFTSSQGITCISLGIFFWIVGEHLTKTMIGRFDQLSQSNFYSHPLVQLVLIKSAILTGLDMLTALKALQIQGAADLENGIPFSVANLPPEFSCLENSYKTGSSPIGAIDAGIDNIYNSQLQQFVKKGEELTVKLTVPLGSCYLPSFILIGIIPTIIALM